MNKLPRLLFLACFCTATLAAQARVTRFEITGTAPHGSFRPGEFVRVKGFVSGELSPAEQIPGLDRAPRRDADGMSLGGVRLPDVEAPLGTHGAQNLPLSDRACNLNAAYIPFARTPSERAAGDTRPALAERYASRDVDLQRIRDAGRKLVAERFLLPADALEIERAAGAIALP